MIDQILEKYGLKYEDLNAVEKKTFNEMVKSVQQKTLTIQDMKEYFATMRDSVADELAKAGHESKQDLLLKGRMRNYLLTLDVLTAPEKAQKRIEQALEGLKV